MFSDKVFFPKIFFPKILSSEKTYHSVSSSPSARRPSSAFDGVNEEANVRANAAVVPGYADVRASAAMTDDNNDDGDDGNFDDTLSEILGISSRVATSPDLDLAFGAVDVNVDRACTSLLSPLSHLSPPTSSPPSSAAAGEPIWDPGVFTIIIIFLPHWWLSYNKLFYLSKDRTNRVGSTQFLREKLIFETDNCPYRL